MTKDGFVFLVMGFTGKAASQIKEAYINAFNWMAEQLIKMQHSHIKQYNDLMLEYMKEKDIASLSGRLLRKRQDKKLAYQSRMLPDNVKSKYPLMQISSNQIFTAVKAKSFQGRLLSEWASNIEDDRLKRVANSVRTGFKSII